MEEDQLKMKAIFSIFPPPIHYMNKPQSVGTLRLNAFRLSQSAFSCLISKNIFNQVCSRFPQRNGLAFQVCQYYLSQCLTGGTTQLNNFKKSHWNDITVCSSFIQVPHYEHDGEGKCYAKLCKCSSLLNEGKMLNTSRHWYLWVLLTTRNSVKNRISSVLDFLEFKKSIHPFTLVMFPWWVLVVTILCS